MSELVAVAIGLIAGVVAGLTGVGGGILFVPALAIFLDKPQIEAEATSLVAIIPVALVGAWRQRGYGNVRVKEGILIGVLSPIGVLAGVVLANAVSQRALEIAFAGLTLFVAYRLVRRALGPQEGGAGPARGGAGAAGG